MSQYWFRPKSDGYGATPSIWKGWPATGAFAAFVAIPALLLVSAPAQPPPAVVAAYLLLAAVLTAALVWFCRAKTDGQWRWRWGKYG